MTLPDGLDRVRDMDSSNEVLETALTGHGAIAESDAIVADLVSALRAETSGKLPPEADAHIAAAAATVPTQTATPSPTPARSSAGRLRRRTAVVAATFGLFVATAGVALAAHHSYPGQALYGIDVALEKVGILAGGPGERAHEVMQLLESGQTGLALGHAAATVAALPPQAQGGALAAADLDFAAQQIGDIGEPAPVAVEALLAYLASHIGNADGGVVGETVAELAEAIKNSVLESVPPVTVPGGPPGTVPAPPITVPGPPG